MGCFLLSWQRVTFDSPRFRQASWLVHFHSFSLVATLTSSMTSGTQPPNTNMRLEIMVAVCRERGRGAFPWTMGFTQDIESKTGINRQTLHYLVH